MYTEARPIKITPSMGAKLQRQGWEFEWHKPKAGFQVHALYEAGTDNILGLFATQEPEEGGFIEIDIAETNPKNSGKNGEYKHTLRSMIACVAAESFLKGYGGCVKWKSKSSLISFYEQNFNVMHINEQEMYIADEESVKLLDSFKGN